MSHAPSLRPFLLTLMGVTLSLMSARAQEGFEITAVARLGDQVHAPATLVSASLPILSDTGSVLFRGDGGLLLTSTEGHIVVAAPGDVVPDGRMIAAIQDRRQSPGDNRVSGPDASVNAGRQVAFVASLQPPGSAALFLFSDGTITTVTEGPALGSPSLNKYGHIAFAAGNRILLYADGVTTELVRLDDPALVQGGLGFRFASVSLNDAGQVVFSTAATGSGGLPSGVGVYLIADGEVRVVAHRGTVAPDGGTFTFPFEPSLNARGDVAFRGIVTAPSRSGIFVFSDEALTQIVRDGDVIEKYTLLGVFSPSIDAEGQVAYEAFVSPVSRGVFLFSAGITRPLVVPGDLTVQGDVVSSAFAPSLNTHGELAFAESVASFGRVYRLTAEGISRVAGEGDDVAAVPRVVSASMSSIRSIGQPVFVASIFPGIAGIFDVDGTLRVRTGDVLPGGGAVPNIPGRPSFTSITSNAVGTVAFESGNGIFFSRRDGSLTEVVRSGSPRPGGGTFSSVSDPWVNAADQVAFWSISAGVFLASDGAIAPVVRVGDPFPGGGQFTEALRPSLNDSGHVAFNGTNASPPAGDVFVSSGEGVKAIVRVGDPAPDGGIFSNLVAPQLNAVGQIAFSGTVLPLPPGASGIFLFSPDEGVRSVVRAGDPAPGGGTFGGAFTSFTLDARGRIAFQGAFSNPSDSGVFLLSDGNLEAVARPGDPAPEGNTFTSASDPKLTTDGGILFTAVTSTGTGVFLARRPTETRPVRIDIRPAGQANRINPASDRHVPVAILFDDGFDPVTVIADTVRFGATGTEAAPTRVVVRDVDGDGDDDVVFRFRILDTGIQCGQTSALLTGRTSDGRTFTASDVIHTVRCP